MSGTKPNSADPAYTSPSRDPLGRRFPGVQIEQLLAIFYGPPSHVEQLGQFESVAQVPPPFDQLLDHHEHMTVKVEAFFGQSVDVQVHRSQREGAWYAREITLVAAESGKVVQYGIVRLKIDALSPEVWQRVESQAVPLGRVLIEHDVLREVQLQGLWRVQAGPALAELLRVPVGQVIYGRTALIFCDGEPAIELLEIVTNGRRENPS